MVFPDLSAPEARSNSSAENAFPIASVADRLVALILDFLIFSPIISLLVAGFLKQTRTLFLLNSSSSEALIAVGLLMALVFFFTVVLQAVFLFFWQATPGQFFLQLRVVSYPTEQERLSLNQCFLRAFMWSTGFLLLGIPFLEVASHPLRRAFHERASDTAVITLKRVADDGPHPIESRFIASWMRMSFLVLLFMGAMGVLSVYRGLVTGEYRGPQTVVSGCKELGNSELVGEARLDAAFTLFLLNEISPECLSKEADTALWNDPLQSEGLGYLAKFMTVDDNEQSAYYDKVCENTGSVVCALARSLKDDSSLLDLSEKEQSLWTVQFMISEEKFANADVVGSLRMIEELQKVAVLKNALEKRFVRSVWALQEGLGTQRRMGRLPASSDDSSESWLEKFKERYEVP